MAKTVVDGKCPYCGSTQGFTERFTQSMLQSYDFDGKATECQALSHRGGTRQYCANCERQINIPNVEQLKKNHVGLKF